MVYCSNRDKKLVFASLITLLGSTTPDDYIPHWAISARTNSKGEWLNYPLHEIGARSPQTDKTDELKLKGPNSPQNLRSFLNTYVQIDYETGQSLNQEREHAIMHCGAAALIGAALLMSDKSGDNVGLGYLIDVVDQWDGLSSEDQSLLEEIRDKIATDKLTRKDIKRLQHIVGEFIANDPEKGHGTSISRIKERLEGSAFDARFQPDPKNFPLISIDLPDTAVTHFVLRVDENTIFDPWPRIDGNQLITDEEALELYQEYKL